MEPLTPEDIDLVRAWLKRHGILRPEDYRASFLERRLSARLVASGCTGMAGFLKEADGSAEKSRALLQRFFIPTTEFLRNREVLEAAAALLAARFGPPGGPPLRALSAACSTGEEPFGLALLLAEAGVDARILALDRSLPALRRLKAGIFGEEVLAKVDKGLKERYFIRTASGFRVGPRLAKRVFPACWDLGWGLPPGPFQVVLLRNVLIYLTEEAKGRLLGEASRSLAAGGLLVLGRVESIGKIGPAAISPLDRENRIYERVP